MRDAVEELVMEHYDLLAYRNDNGDPPEIKVRGGTTPISWWRAGQYYQEVMNTVLLRKRFPDWFELPCFKEENEKRVPNKVILNLTPYQYEQVYEQGNAVIYAFSCKCGEPKFVTIQPTREVCQYAPEIPLHELPMATINSGPSPV